MQTIYILLKVLHNFDVKQKTMLANITIRWVHSKNTLTWLGNETVCPQDSIWAQLDRPFFFAVGLLIFYRSP